MATGKIKLGLDQFIADVIINGGDSQRLCFVLGSGASVTSGIPVGGRMEMDWMNYIMEQSDGYIAGVRKTAASLYKNKDLDHRFSEIKRAWKEAKNAGRDTLPGKYYFDIFVLRFYSKKGSGIEELQRLMRGCEPSVGYYVLSRLLTKDNCRNNLVITTNFDSLMEKAVFAFTEQAPVAVSHEALLEAMDWKVRYPIVAKVHRDLLFKPLNSTREVSELKEGWQEPLRRVLANYTPIVIGYAGADKSLMSFFEDSGTSFPNGLYWCYREQSGEPDDRIKALVKSKGGFLVPIEGFDELMVRISRYNNPDDDPDDAAVLKGLKKRYDGNTERLSKELEAITERIEAVTPTTYWGYVNRGNSHFNSGKLKKAIADYTKAIEKKSDYAEAYNNRGVAHSDLGEYEKAVKDLNNAIKLNPDFAEFYNNFGTTYGKWGKYEEAIMFINKAIDLKPDYAEAYSNRGNAYSKCGKYEKAIADFNEAIKLNPNLAEAYYNRGVMYNKQGKNEKAIADFSEAIRLKTDYTDAYNNRGVAYSDLGEYEKAIADYVQALKIMPALTESYYNCGNAYANLGQYPEAITKFTKAIELKPEFVESYHNRGNAYAVLGKYEEAIADFTKTIELKSEFAESYYNRGVAYSNLCEYEKAIADYDKAIELKDDYSKAYNNRGVAYNNLGMGVENILKKSIFRNEIYRKAVTYYDTAINNYDAAIKVDPDYAEAYYNRSIAYAKLDKYDKARADYNKAIELDPTLNSDE